MRSIHTAIAITVCTLVVVGAARAEVKVPTIFGDNMVLQRDVELPIWGRAAAGEKVTVSIGAASVSATADKDGAWVVKLPAMECTPNQTGATMTIKGTNTITLKNIRSVCHDILYFSARVLATLPVWPSAIAHHSGLKS